MVSHFRDLFGAKCFVLIIQPVTIPLKQIDVVGVCYRLGMEKVLTKLSIIVLNGSTVLAQLPERRDEVHHIRCVTQFSDQCRMDFGPQLHVADVVEHVCSSRTRQFDAKNRVRMRDIVTGAHEELIHLSYPSRELTGVRRVKDWYSVEHFAFEVLHAVIVSVGEGSVDGRGGWRRWGGRGWVGVVGGRWGRLVVAKWCWVRTKAIVNWESQLKKGAVRGGVGGGGDVKGGGGGDVGRGRGGDGRGGGRVSG